MREYVYGFPMFDLAKKTELFLEFDATQAEPPLEGLFLANGGEIGGAAARGSIDFAVTGSTRSTVVTLNDRASQKIRVPILSEIGTEAEDGKNTAVLDQHAKLLMCSTRQGAAINGSLVSSIAGQGTTYLADVLQRSDGHMAVGLTYGSWLAQSSVVAISGARLVDAEGKAYHARFVGDTMANDVLKRADGYVSKWVEAAWQMRTSEGGLVYPPSPGLTKSVAKQPVGINGNGYDFVHNVMLLDVPYSYATVNEMLERLVQIDMEFVPEEIDNFMEETRKPGLRAARHARSFAASMSMAAAWLVSYRADGRTRVDPTGSRAVEAESWLRQAPRSPLHANDCDGSALLTSSIARAVSQASESVRAAHPYINAFHNVLVPHYVVGLCVVGASGASAETSGDAKGVHVAGHAISLMVPTTTLLRSLDQGSGVRVGGMPIVDEAKAVEVASARMRAMFDDAKIASVPEDERPALSSWETCSKHDFDLRSFAIEGTTWASPWLSVEKGSAYNDAARNARMDQKAIGAVGPTVGRSIKIMYAGPNDARGNTHVFYHDLVEFTVDRTSPLWSDAGIRQLGCAATQFVLTTSTPQSRVAGALWTAGVAPNAVATGAFAAVPLVSVSEDTAGILDFASHHADADVIPPRDASMKLSQFSSTQLKRSLAALEALNETMKTAPDGEGHTIAYVIAYSTLVNNPAAIEHLCTQVGAKAVSGMVDALDVAGLAVDVDGAEAGKLVVVNAKIPV